MHSIFSISHAERILLIICKTKCIDTVPVLRLVLFSHPAGTTSSVESAISPFFPICIDFSKTFRKFTAQFTECHKFCKCDKTAQMKGYQNRITPKISNTMRVLYVLSLFNCAVRVYVGMCVWSCVFITI